MSVTIIVLITATYVLSYASGFAHGIHTQASAGQNDYLIRWPAITALVIGLLVHSVGAL